jgi:hypothetical protein
VPFAPSRKDTHIAGYIEDRWIKKKKDPSTGKRDKTARYGKGKRYRVAGIPGVRDRSFDVLEAAKAWLRRAATDEERGEFVDPRDGSITLAEYIATQWAPGRGGVPKTQDNQERRARLHIVPHLGQLPLRNITSADLRAYIAKLESTVSSVDYQRGILSELSSILRLPSMTSGSPGTPCTRSPCGGRRRHRSVARLGRWRRRCESATSSTRAIGYPSSSVLGAGSVRVRSSD